MRNAVLIRKPSSDSETFGTLTLDDGLGLSFATVELPWRENQPFKSCIPTGVYLCTWRYSPRRRGYRYHVENVPMREAIEIHPANYSDQLLGCIALGTAVGYVLGKLGVLCSHTAVWSFEDNLRQENFELTIKGE